MRLWVERYRHSRSCRCGTDFPTVSLVQVFHPNKTLSSAYLPILRQPVLWKAKLVTYEQDDTVKIVTSAEEIAARLLPMAAESAS